MTSSGKEVRREAGRSRASREWRLPALARFIKMKSEGTSGLCPHVPCACHQCESVCERVRACESMCERVRACHQPARGSQTHKRATPDAHCKRAHAPERRGLERLQPRVHVAHHIFVLQCLRTARLPSARRVAMLRRRQRPPPDPPPLKPLAA